MDYELEQPLNPTLNAQNNPLPRHLHWACNHELQMGQLSMLPQDPQINNTAFGIIVMHPRWCQHCLVRRMEALLTLKSERLATIEQTLPPEKKWKHWSYVNGVITGRMDALATPLEESLHIRRDEKRKREAARLAGILESHHISHTASAPEAVNQLVEAMKKTTIKLDEIEGAMNVAFEIHDNGYYEGREMQARLEQEALLKKDPQIKGELLYRAIL